MPTNHRARLDDDKCVSPSRPELEHRNPEGPVERGELGPPILHGVSGELLTQRKLNDRLLASTANQSGSAAGNEYQELEDGLHGARILLYLEVTFEPDTWVRHGVSLLVGGIGEGRMLSDFADYRN